MFHKFDVLTDTKGNSLVGYQVAARQTGGGSIVTIYADENGTPIQSVSGIANAALTDNAGNYSFFVDPGTYDLDFRTPDGSTIATVRQVPMNGGAKGDTGTATATFDTLAEFREASSTNLKQSLADPAYPAADYFFLSDNPPYTESLPDRIKANDAALSVGVWARQESDSITFDQPETGAERHNQRDKSGLTLSVFDFIPKAQWATIRSGAYSYNAKPALQAAIDAAASRGASFVDLHGALLRLNSGIEIDTAKVGIRGDGAVFNCSSMTTGDVITLVNSDADTNLRAGRAGVREITGIRMIGPGVAVTAVRAFNVEDTTGTVPPQAPAVKLRGITCQDFATDVHLGDGANFFAASHCTFHQIAAGTATTPSIDMPSSTNAGERINFTDCFWFNRGFFIGQTNADTSSTFVSCSWDYPMDGRMAAIAGGSVTILGGHIEGDSDAAHWWRVTTDVAVLNVIGAKVNIAGNLATYSPFYSDAAAVQGGVHLSKTFVAVRPTKTWTTALVAGTGRTVVDGTTKLAVNPQPQIGFAANILAYGGFENASYALSEWTTGGSVTRNTSVKRTGAASMAVKGVSGLAATSAAFFEAKPGQCLSGECWIQTAGVAAASATAVVSVAWLDIGGNSLASAGLIATTTDIGSWTRVQLSISTPAPPGTRKAQVLCAVINMTADATLYVDDVIVNLG